MAADLEQGGSAPFVAAIGEVLWDVFPDGARLGGSSANVAFHAARLGAHSLLVSRVGNDERGSQALRMLGASGVDVSGVGTDRQAPTGYVRVTFQDQEPLFEVGSGVAWDRIELSPALLERLAASDVVTFGTLAQRTPLVRGRLKRALTELKQRGPQRALGSRHRARPLLLVDLNLRPPFTDPSTIISALRVADVVKLNQREADWVADAAGVRDPLSWIFERFPTDLVAVTRGARGASLIGRTVSVHAEGLPVSGGDPVGAGDAFVASLACALAKNQSWPASLEAANRHAAWVASQPGAMPA